MKYFREAVVYMSDLMNKEILKKGLSSRTIPFISLSLFDSCGLADSITEIVEFCSSDFTTSDFLDVVNLWRMQRQHSLDADAIADAAHGDRLSYAATLPSD